jgi:hypothetical protein
MVRLAKFADPGLEDSHGVAEIAMLADKPLHVGS